MANLRTRHLVPGALLTAAGAAPLMTAVCLVLNLADAAVSTDFVLDKKFVILDCVCISKGACTGSSIQLKTSTPSNISDDMTLGAAGAITRAASIDTTKATIAAGGTLRTTQTQAGGPVPCTAMVLVSGFYSA